LPKLWLPITYGGRTRNILIPNAHDIDDSQLDEIIAWQKEKTLKELKSLPEKKPVDVMKSKEIGKLLNERLQFFKRKGVNPKYF
jgi:hypothetical protein